MNNFIDKLVCYKLVVKDKNKDNKKGLKAETKDKGKKDKKDSNKDKKDKKDKEKGPRDLKDLAKNCLNCGFSNYLDNNCWFQYPDKAPDSWKESQKAC